MGERVKTTWRGRIATRTARPAVILAALLSVTAPPDGAAAQAEPDSAGLREYVATYEDVWDTHDASALSALYSEDADLVAGSLPAARGRRAIRDAWAAYFARQEPERRLTIEVISARLLSPGVAVVSVATTTGGRDGEGEPLTARKARGTWLLRRHDGGWLIEALRALPTERDSVELVSTREAAEALRPGLRAFVAAYEDAFNGHDPEAIGAFYAEDAEIVVRNSPVVRGRRAVLDWWRAYFSEPRPAPLARDSWYESMRAILIVDEIRMMAPDVALLEITATAAARQADARPSPVRYARATWVVVREAGEWRIASLWVLPSEDDRVIRRSGG